MLLWGLTQAGIIKRGILREGASQTEAEPVEAGLNHLLRNQLFLLGGTKLKMGWGGREVNTRQQNHKAGAY